MIPGKQIRGVFMTIILYILVYILFLPLAIILDLTKRYR